MSSVQARGKQFYSSLEFCNPDAGYKTKLDCQLDTGATCNVLTHRDLSEGIRRPKYQLPTLEEVLPKLSKTKVFTTLDAKDGFYQITLDKRSSKLTTFWTPFGRYRYLRMPFGVNAAPEEFECKLQEHLSDLNGVDVLRDDILVSGSGDTIEEANADHDANLTRLLQRACKVNLKFNS